MSFLLLCGVFGVFYMRESPIAIHRIVLFGLQQKLEFSFLVFSKEMLLRCSWVSARVLLQGLV